MSSVNSAGAMYTSPPLDGVGVQLVGPVLQENIFMDLRFWGIDH